MGSAHWAAFKGASLQPATWCRWARHAQSRVPAVSSRAELAPSYPKSLELRVLTGLYFHRLTDEAAGIFFEDTWRSRPKPTASAIASAGGRPLSFVERKQPFGAGSDPSNIVDAGYPYGSIQVPGGARADHPASRCRVRRRLRHDRHRDQRRHGSRRADAAEQSGAFRGRRHGSRAESARRVQGA